MASTSSAGRPEDRHPMTGNRTDPGTDTGYERHQYDVVVIGAGGAGLRAAIAAHDAGARVAILLPDSADRVKQKIEDPDAAITLEGELLDTDVGQWVYDHEKPAGHGTDTLPAAAALYLPLKAPMRTRGVLAAVLRDEQVVRAYLGTEEVEDAA